MIKVISPRDFNPNYLDSLRAASLLCQELVKAEFFHYSSKSILDPKKVGFLATETVVVQGNVYFCIFSFLCEKLDFSLMKGKLVYDYNQEKTVLLGDKVGTEILPVLRIAQNKDNSSALLIKDRVKVDFFSFSESKLNSTTLFFQLLSQSSLLKELSRGDISKLEDLTSLPPSLTENSFIPQWRSEFLARQILHVSEVSKSLNVPQAKADYKESLAAEGINIPFTL